MLVRQKEDTYVIITFFRIINISELFMIFLPVVAANLQPLCVQSAFKTARTRLLHVCKLWRCNLG